MSKESCRALKNRLLDVGNEVGKKEFRSYQGEEENIFRSLPENQPVSLTKIDVYVAWGHIT